MEARLLTSAQHSRGDIGALFSDSEFERLIAHLNRSDVSLLKQPLRSNLDFVRELLVKSVLFESQKPRRKAIHEALKIVGNRLRSFLAATADLDEPTIRDLESIKILGVGHATAFQVFLSLPLALRALAASAKSTARAKKPHANGLLVFSSSADGLADALHFLDFASQSEVLGVMPWTSDYHLRSLKEVVHIARRVFEATGLALETGKKRGGPKPVGEMKEVVARLAEIFEACGGKFTHTPYVKTEYDGKPQSKAGQFVRDFLTICDPSIRPKQVSQWMAGLIHSRNAPSRRKMMARETIP
ncbi:hypothetical protein [Bradyrhizobium sp. AZCC 2289]|uniref:hypothetical protein n=1 Tax=Bradyrhizobium sp. AZCC 2289 TaxID=3117026 RepID=UPI002FF3E9A3